MADGSRRPGVQVSVETVIARPRADVAAYAMDPANDRSWIGALTGVTVLSPGPMGVGTRVERVAQFLGRRMEYVNEVVEYEPPALLAMRSVKAPFPMTVRYEFEDAGAGTRVRIRTEGDASGFYRLAGPLLSAAVRRSIASDLGRLKTRLEGAPGSR
jgi:hypothetical protein